MSGANPTDPVSDVDGSDEGAVEPLFRVVRGTPTDVELAALSVVLAARMHPGDEADSSGPKRPVFSGARSSCSHDV